MKRVTAVFFLGVIGVFTFLVLAGVVLRAKDKLQDTRVVIDIDWEKLYPFNDGQVHKPLKEFNNFYEYLQKRAEEYTSVKLLGAGTIVEAERTYEELIGWNIASVSDYNPVIKLSDGYLSDLTESRDVSRSAGAVIDFAGWCAENSISFSYINLPNKVCPSEDKDISGTLDFSNQNADRFLHLLSDAGVRHYDFREFLHAEGMSHHGAFFRTDHHWKPESGLWAAKHILHIFRDDYGWNVEPSILDPANFEHVIYPAWFLGSQGKKVTLARTQPDDITMLYPKFPASLRIEVPQYGLNLSGDFSVVYDMRHIASRDYYRRSPYGTYKYGDQPLTLTHNLLNHDGRKLLIIHDSMSNCVIPFLALGVEYVDEIDLRHFTGSLRSYVLSSRPDAVIVCYYAPMPGRLESPGQRRVNLKLYDFR